MKTTFIVSIVCLLLMSASGQYEIVTNDFEVTGNGLWTHGNGISCVDINKDGWDDLTVCDTNQPIDIYLNNQQGGFVHAAYISNTKDAKHPIWVDYDNDEDYDLFVSYYQGSCKLYRNDGNFATMVDVTANLNLPNDYSNSFGCSWSDYDLDGFLDLYVSNFHDDMDLTSTNWLLHNNGNGTFSNVTTSTGVGNGFRSTFQSVFADFDMNGYTDLYIANDHSMVNEMYMNTNGNFTPVGTSNGTAIAINSMCASVSDYDRDGDFDLYVTNNPQGNYLLRNNSMQFTNVALLSGSGVFAQSWGATWLDADNDGWEDLHVCVANIPNTLNRLLMNNQNGQFIEWEMDSIAPVNWTYASARGDFDNDGYADLITSSSLPTQVTQWKNTFPRVNNWIKVRLNALAGEADPYGAIIKCYSGNQCSTASLYCGDNYISQDSEYKIFGLGSATQADSVVVIWPGGWTDTFENLSAGMLHELNKGGSFYIDQNSIDPIILCSGNSITISPGVTGNYLWQNGTDNNTLEVAEGGTYEVTITNEFGLSQIISYTVIEEQSPSVEVVAIAASCSNVHNGKIILTVEGTNPTSVIWNDGDLQPANPNLLMDLPPGTYTYQVINENNCQQNGIVTVSAPPPLLCEWATDTVCYGGTTACDIVISGGTPPYQTNWNGSNPEMLEATTHTLTITDSHQCISTEMIEVIARPQITIECEVPKACYGQTVAIEINASGGTGSLTTHVLDNNYATLSAGQYVIQAVDSLGCIATQNITVEEAAELVASAEIFHALNGNNGSISITVTGGVEPYTYLWNNGEQTATLNNVCQGIYSCEITDAIMCSKTIEVQVIDLGTEEQLKLLSVYPNPFSSYFILNASADDRIRITDSTGRVIYSQNNYTGVITIDTADWADGVYFLKSERELFTLVKMQ